MIWSINNVWLWALAVLVVVVVVTIRVRKKMSRGADIEWPDFPDTLNWSDAKSADASLAAIYGYAAGFASGSVKWYHSRRRPKRFAGFLLRLSALLATFIAGLVPLSQDLGLPEISPQVSTLLLALAGLFVAIDKFGGYTSGWVRYMLAQQKVERARDAFVMDWNAMKFDPVDRQAMLEKAKSFLLSIGKIVDDETQEWATEFQSALNELERARKAEAETPRTGALEVSVKNHQLVVGGWTLEVDGNQRGTTGGKTQAVSDVPIGMRKVRASGKDGQGKALADERIVKIEGGVTATRELDLS